MIREMLGLAEDILQDPALTITVKSTTCWAVSGAATIPTANIAAIL